MTLDDYLGVGRTVTLGSHRFEPEEIKTFARKFDPQPFHMDEKSAQNSVFGRLCASGWHTASMWMRYNVEKRAEPAWSGPGPDPQFGPSPGFRNLKWLKPVYAGDTLYPRLAVAGLKPQRTTGVLTLASTVHNQKGWLVLEGEQKYLLKRREAGA